MGAPGGGQTWSPCVAGKVMKLVGLQFDLAQLFDALEDVQFWVKDRAGRYCTMNRACLLNYGLNGPSQAVGLTDFDLSPPHIATQFRLDDERVLQGATIVNRIELVGRFDHTAVWCVTNKIPLRDPRGRIVGTAGVARPLQAGAGLQGGPGMGLVPALAFMREHLAGHVPNADLARACALSLRVFLRRFRAEFGLTPHAYLRRLRVRLACRPLVYSDAPLAAIATEHGFSDQSHFGREFRREIGMTPAKYRRHFRAA